jgi:hypothetical protein
VSAEEYWLDRARMRSLASRAGIFVAEDLFVAFVIFVAEDPFVGFVAFVAEDPFVGFRDLRG